MLNIIIDFQEKIIRTALVEDGRLVEIIIDDINNGSQMDNIYVGRVKNILPSQFAFIEIGNEKNAFLHLNDFKENSLFVMDERGKQRLNIKQGQQIMVQVLKDETGEKGAYVTTQLSITNKDLVIYVNPNHEVGISKKILSNPERERLRNVVEKILPKEYSAIVRTSCQNKNENVIITELNELILKLNEIIEKGKYVKAPVLVNGEINRVGKTLKDLLTENVDKIIINHEEELETVKRIVGSLYEGFDKKVVLYKEESNIFSNYFIEGQFEKVFNRKIWLKCGGFLIIEQTEACFIIDVNTGKFMGKKNHDATVLKTNLEAAVEIAKQLRLRNLSGMIIIDFIDMRSDEDRKELHNIFSEEIKKDRINTHIVGMTELGLMQVTRKKTREPISNIFMCNCKHCNGTGKIFK